MHQLTPLLCGSAEEGVAKTMIGLDAEWALLVPVVVNLNQYRFESGSISITFVEKYANSIEYTIISVHLSTYFNISEMNKIEN